MDSLKRMISTLKRIGFYNLNGKSLIEAEISEYSYYIDNLMERLNKIIDSIFVDTITQNDINTYSLLYGVTLPETLDSLKQIVKARTQINTSYFTVEGVKNCLLANGIEADITETIGSKTVTVNIRKLFCSYSEIELNQAVEKCFPYYLNVLIVKPI